MALILVVDDEYLLTMMLADILEDEGHEVEVASNGQIALQCAVEKQPALIITDFMMPVMTGLELANAIKANNNTEHIPMILVSGAQGQIAREHPELFHAVLDKPYRNEDLLKEVQEALAPSTQHRSL